MDRIDRIKTIRSGAAFQSFLILFILSIPVKFFPVILNLE
jgi:hypothetical protein